MDMQGSATEQPTPVQNPTAVTQPGPIVEQASVPNPSVVSSTQSPLAASPTMPSVSSSASTSSSTSPSSAPSGSGGAMMKVFLILLVLLGVGVGAYLFMARGNKPQATGITQQEQQQAVVSAVPSQAPVDEFSNDTKNIDDLLSTLDKESGSADLGLNDKQTDLSSN